MCPVSPSFCRTFVTVSLLSIAVLPAAHAQTVFVSSFFSNTVVQVSPTGAVTPFIANEPGANGTAFDTQGSLFVSAENANEVDKYTPQGVKSVVATGFMAPTDLAFGTDGSLFVADALNSQIVKIAPGGTQSVYASFASTTNENPYALAFDPQGNLFVSLDSTVDKIAPNGTVTTFATGFGETDGLAVDGAGNVFVADSADHQNGTGSIVMITPTGSKSVFASNLYVPVGLAFDTAGRLYSTQNGAGTLTRYTNGVPFLVASGLNKPTFVTITNLAAAPEPSTWAAFAVGLFGLGALTIKARKRAA